MLRRNAQCSTGNHGFTTATLPQAMSSRAKSRTTRTYGCIMSMSFQQMRNKSSAARQQVQLSADTSKIGVGGISPYVLAVGRLNGIHYPHAKSSTTLHVSEPRNVTPTTRAAPSRPPETSKTSSSSSTATDNVVAANQPWTLRITYWPYHVFRRIYLGHFLVHAASPRREMYLLKHVDVRAQPLWIDTAALKTKLKGIVRGKARKRLKNALREALWRWGFAPDGHRSRFVVVPGPTSGFDRGTVRSRSATAAPVATASTVGASSPSSAAVLATQSRPPLTPQIAGRMDGRAAIVPGSNAIALEGDKHEITLEERKRGPVLWGSISLATHTPVELALAQFEDVVVAMMPVVGRLIRDLWIKSTEGFGPGNYPGPDSDVREEGGREGGWGGGSGSNSGGQQQFRGVASGGGSRNNSSSRTSGQHGSWAGSGDRRQAPGSHQEHQQPQPQRQPYSPPHFRDARNASAANVPDHRNTRGTNRPSYQERENHSHGQSKTGSPSYRGAGAGSTSHRGSGPGPRPASSNTYYQGSHAANVGAANRNSNASTVAGTSVYRNAVTPHQAATRNAGRASRDDGQGGNTSSYRGNNAGKPPYHPIGRKSS